MLNNFRKQSDIILEPIAKKIKLQANTISYLSLICAVVAGFCAYISFRQPWILIPTSLFIALNGFFDALDGKIARITEAADKRGDFIDHALDRFSDAFIIGGIALSLWVEETIGIAALACILLLSYMGTQAQAVGYERVYTGILGRADRMVILIIAPFIQYIYDKTIYHYFIFEWILIYFIVAGIITIIQRYIAIIQWFNK